MKMDTSFLKLKDLCIYHDYSCFSNRHLNVVKKFALVVLISIKSYTVSWLRFVNYYFEIFHEQNIWRSQGAEEL